MDHYYNKIADNALWDSFYSFDVHLENLIAGTYKELCEVVNCHVCNVMKNT